MNYKKILFATDFSPASDAALHYATAMARDSGARLLILHVEEMPVPYAAGEMVMPAPLYPNPEVRRMLEEVVPDDPSVRYEHHLVQGSPAEEIASVAHQQAVDLLVMGTHGRTGIRRVLMGSVAEAVMRHADCPVLTLKQGSRVPSMSG
jgi:nucleotide-binding universal stress UspA family protein